MYNLVHHRGAPNNAFSIETILFKYIRKIGINFFHPKWPEKEETYTDHSGKEVPLPCPIGRLEIDLKHAIELRNSLTSAIDELQTFRIKELEDALDKAKTLKGKSLKNHCEAFK